MDNKPKNLQKQLNADGSITFKDLSTNDVYDFYGKKIASGNLGEKKRVAKEQYRDKVRSEQIHPELYSDEDIDTIISAQPDKLQQLDKQVEDTYNQQFPTPDIATLKYFEEAHTKEAQFEEFKTNPIKYKDYTDYLNKIEDAYELRRVKDQSESILHTAQTDEDFNSDWYKQNKSKVDAIDETIVHKRIQANKDFADSLFESMTKIANELGYIPIPEEFKDEWTIGTGLDAFKSILKGNFGSKSVLSSVDTGMGIIRGFNSLVYSGLKSTAIMMNTLGARNIQLNKDFSRDYNYENELMAKDLENNPLWRLGDYMEKNWNRPGMSEIKRTNIWDNLSNGLGSMIGFIVMAKLYPSEVVTVNQKLYPGVRIANTSSYKPFINPERGAVALSGGLTQMSQGYEDARQYNASYDTAIISAMNNFAIGLSEEVPIEKFLHSIGKFKDTTWREFIREKMIGGFEEFIQEGGSQFWGNVNAKMLYDANRNLSDGVMENGATGFISAMLMQASVHSYNKYSQKKLEDLQSKIQEDQKLKEQARTDALIKIFDERIKFYENQIKEEQEYLAKNNDLVSATQKVAHEQATAIANDELASIIKYDLKATDILNSDRAAQIFAKGEKNNWTIDKTLSELGVPKDQVALIKNITGSDKTTASDREFIALDLMSQYTKVVEINEGVENSLFSEDRNNDNEVEFDDKDGNKYRIETEYEKENGYATNFISKNGVRISDEEYRLALKNYERPSQEYKSMSSPGGVKYREWRVTTPGITPIISNHASFTQADDIGWARVDEKGSQVDQVSNINEIKESFTTSSGRTYFPVHLEISEDDTIIDWRAIDENGREYDIVPDNNVIQAYNSLNTKPSSEKILRVNEMQSDTFQKGRNREDLIDIKGESDEFGNERNPLYTESRATKDNSFLQLLNKNNNWIPFFIKSLIQEAKNRQYEKIWFPSGETAAKLEGHELISNRIKQINSDIDRLKERLKNRYSILEVKGKSRAPVNGQYHYFSDKEKAKEFAEKNFKDYDLLDNLKNYYYDIPFGESKEDDEKVLKLVNDSISNLESEKQRYKTEGLDKLAPIEHFYENTIQNVLRKNYEVNRITDEFGNDWFEVDLSKTSDKILLSKSQSDIIDNSEYKKSVYYSSEETKNIQVNSVLDKIANNSSNPGFKELATQLSKIVNDTKVSYFKDADLSENTTISKDDRNRVNMVYSPKNNLIKIINDNIASPENFERAFLHEVIHSLTYEGLRNNPEFRAKIQEFFDIASKRSKDLTAYFQDYASGKYTLDEFLTHAFTDERIQKVLSQIEYNSREFTPDNVSNLKDNEVFVFGSNAEGVHGKGAALTAKQKFGAIQGKSKGLQGKSYAVITKKNWRVEKSSSLQEIKNELSEFIDFANKNQDKKFLVTKLGSSLAGYSVQEIKSIFNDLKSKLSDNIILPKEYEVRESSKKQTLFDKFVSLIKDFVSSLFKPSEFKWARFDKNSYELSSQGDKRFSALVAKLKDGRTIEEAYQLDVKGYRKQGNDWRLGKGKAPLITISKEELYQKYKDLWRQYFKENPSLLEDLRKKADGKVLTDKFASTPISQARAISEILNETSDKSLDSSLLSEVIKVTSQHIESNFEIKTSSNLDNLVKVLEKNKFEDSDLKPLLNNLTKEDKLFLSKALNKSTNLSVDDINSNTDLEEIKYYQKTGKNLNQEIKRIFQSSSLYQENKNFVLENKSFVDSWKTMSPDLQKELEKDINKLKTKSEWYQFALSDLEGNIRENLIKDSNKTIETIIKETINNLNQEYSRNIANTDIENEFQRTNETNNTVSNGLNSNGNVPPRNDINERGINTPQKLYNLPSVVQNFVNSQGVPIFNSIEDALETVDEIYTQAEDNIKEGKSSYSKEREALQIWKDSFTGNNVLEQYSGINAHSLSNLEALDKAQKEKNGQDYLEFIWHNLRNKINSPVYVLNEKGELTKSNYSYEESGSRKSTVRDKRQWQVYQEWFTKELGIEFEVNELRITDAIAKVESDKLQEFYYNLDKQLFSQGLIAIYNEKENLVFDINSIKDKSGAKYDVQNMSMEDIIVDWTNTYWKSLLGDIGMSKLTKRLTAVTGKAANNLITDTIANEIGYDNSRAIYLETDKNNQETGRVIVNTAIFDTNTISQTIKDSFPNWKKDMLADGAEFELQIVHDTYNNLNGVDFTDRGMASKSKTIIPGKALFKSARFVVIPNSPLHKFMLKNNIGRLTVSSALKIDNGYSNTEHLDWKTVSENPFIDSDKHIFKHDITQDSYLSSHGKVKNRAKGTLASFMTTSLSAFANKEYRPALEKHLETHLADLQEYMTKAKDNNFMATELKEFIASQTDGYRTYLMDFLENQDLTNSPEFVEEPSIVNFFLRNILTSKIEDTLSHQEKGAYPALYPDLGPLTGFNTLKDVNLDAFDQHGFIKPGYFLLDKLSAQKNNLKSGDKALVGCNPPASIADLRGLEMAGATPNKLNSSETSLENERGSKINTNYLVVNNEQFVGNSGKDFDIDKVIVVKVNTPELETIWKNTQQNDARLHQILDAFNSKYRGNTYLEKLQTIFGADNKSIDLNSYQNINHFNKLLQTMEIGRVYNIKMYYQAILEATNNGKSNLEWTEKDDEGRDHKYTMIVNKEDINSNLAILYHLTNMALDWQSNQEIFKINYTPVKLAGELVDIYRDGKKLQQEYITKKGYLVYPNGSAFYDLARNNLKPLRDLLRFQTDEQDKPKMKVLFDQMKAAKEITDQENNLFKDTTLFKSVKYFIDNFKIDNFGHNFKDIVQLLTNLKNDLTGKEDLNDLGYAPNKNATRTAKLGEFFNKVFALTLSPKSGYYTMDKNLNPYQLINNTDNTFTLFQISYYGKQIPFLNNFYTDLLTDLFDKKLFEINAKSEKKEVYWRTIGTTSNAKFFVTPLKNNILEFRKENYSNGKLTSTKTYQSFKQMLDDQSGHTLRNAIKDSDGFSQKDLTDVFKFTNNRILGDYLNNQLFKKIVEFSEKESQNWSARELELLYKSLFGIYDYKFNPADKTGKGYDNSLKSRLMGLQIGEPLVYTDRVTNIEDPITGEILDTKKSPAIVNNKFPAFRALQQVAQLDNTAGQIGKQVLDNVISTYNNQLKSLHIQDNDLPSIQKAEDVVGQKELKLNTVNQSLEDLIGMSFKGEHFSDFQIAAYYKKAESAVTSNDRASYLLNQAQEAYGFLETKLKRNPTSQEVSKFLISNYNKADKEASNVVLSALYVKNKLYDQQVKDYSNKNLTYTQNQDKIVSVSFQGRENSLNLGDILNDFRIYRMANEPARISGAMIDYSSRQAIDRKYRTISEDITSLYFNIPSLFPFESATDTNLIDFGDDSILKSEKLQSLIFQISEQKDSQKILKNLDIIDGVFNYKGQVVDAFSYSGIDKSPSKRTNLDIDKILNLAEIIYNDKNVKPVIDDAFGKSLYVRAIGAALVNRYIADYYVPTLLENHLKDLNFYAQQAAGLVDSEMKVEILNSVLALKTKAEQYYSNYTNKAIELKGKDIRYMPHNFYSEGKLMEGLIRYYTEKGMSQEVAEKKAEEIVSERKAEKDNIFNYLGISSEHNFEHRELDFIDSYSHSLTEIYNYANDLVQFVHSQNLQVLENLNKRYLTKESTFMKRQRDFMAAITRNKTIGIQEVEFNKINKNDYVMFIYKSKGNYFDKVGRITEISKKDGIFEIEDMEGKTRRYSKFETIRFRKAFGITLTKKFVIATMGAEYAKKTDEELSYLFTTIVNARAKMLLGFDHIWFGGKNYFGGRINLWSQVGKLPPGAYTLFEKYENLIKNPSSFKDGKTLNEFLKVLLQNTGAIGGDITNAIERTGGVMESTGKYLSPDTLEYLNKSNKEWIATRASLKDLERVLKSTPADINWEKAQTLKERIKFNLDRIDDFYKRNNLNNIVFGVADSKKASIIKHWNAALVEKEIRGLTAVVAANRVFDIFKDQIVTAKTVEQGKLIKDYATRLAGREIIKYINNTQFDYKKGFKTSHFDSTYLGKPFTQFRHYTQSQLSTYIAGMENVFAQMNRFGFTNVVISSLRKDSDLSYDITISDGKTSATINLKDQNELAILYRRTFANMVSSTIIMLDRALGFSFYGYLGSSIIGKAIEMLFIGQVAGSVNYSTVSMVLQAGMYWLGMMFNTIIYSDDEDKDKKLKKILALLGEDEKEWSTRTIDKARNKIGNSAYEIELKDLHEQYNREILKKFQMALPLGIGESQLIELVGNWIMNGTAPTNEMYLNFGRTAIPGLNLLSTINTSLGSPLWNIDRNPIDTKVNILEKENKRIKELEEMKTRTTEEQKLLENLRKTRNNRISQKKEFIKKQGKLDIYKSIKEEDDKSLENAKSKVEEDKIQNPQQLEENK